ncbi:hypothetical protein [Micrococcus luteus]|uniref:hypothetical protein n=1 Tax=Micrococcus luteus TaxID=1270 RepID=UPI00230277C3|nr:hypothetical protein [Micrococcus luteus]
MATTAPVTAAYDSRKSVREDGSRYPFRVAVGGASVRRYFFDSAERAAAFVRALGADVLFDAGVLAPSGKSYASPWASLGTRGEALEVCVAICDHSRARYAEDPRVVAAWDVREVETRAEAAKHAEARARQGERAERTAAFEAARAGKGAPMTAPGAPVTEAIVDRLLADEAATRELLGALVAGLACLRATDEPTEDDERVLTGPVWDTLGALIEDGQERVILREAAG